MLFRSRQGKALYVGLSNYSGAQLAEAVRLTRELNLSPIVATQVGYSMLRRGMEQDVLPVARDLGMGVVAFSPLAQGLLSPKYLTGVPDGSRAARSWTAAQREGLTPALRERLRQLNEIAKTRGQTLPQMAIAWTLRVPEVTSALIGASEVDQLEENAKALQQMSFTDDELVRIDSILRGTVPSQAAD